MINTTAEQALVNLGPHVVSELGQLNVGPVQYDRVAVNFTLDKGVLEGYADALVDNLINADTSITGNITTTMMVKYLNTLLLLRIQTVTRDNKRFQYLDQTPMPTVPAFFSVFLENVGLVRDSLLGVELYPSFGGDVSPEGGHVLEPIGFSAFSRTLARFERAGFEFTTRLPRDVKGSWELMSMQMIQGELRNHDGKSHKVYALLSSMYDQVLTEGVLLPRVSYGPTSRFGGLVKEFAKFKS